MNLEEWGWSEFFAKDFAARAGQNQLAARVVRGEKNYFRVVSTAGELTVRFAGKVRHRADGRADLPVVGDWVIVELQSEQRGQIIDLLARTTSFSRNLPGHRKRKGRTRAEQQVIAANIDLIFVVSGLDRDFNLRRIERYLTLVGGCGAEAVILLNKSDLCPDAEERLRQVEEIAGGAPVHLCRALDPPSLVDLHPYLLSGRTLALLGSSGVGKSTIINALLGESRQKVAAVSSSDGKGRHTTTNRELIRLPGGAILMDNPGMRELHLWGEPEDLTESFPEIGELAVGCRFSDCRHRAEPGCAVLAAAESGALLRERLASYHKLMDELAETQKRW